MVAVRAIYEDGHLKLLDPLDLIDGQQVEVIVNVKTHLELLREALADLDIQWADPNTVFDDDVDEEALMQEIEEAFSGEPPLSQYIIEDRGEV